MIFGINLRNEIVAIAPRTECLETPINDPKKLYTTYSNGMNYHILIITETIIGLTKAGKVDRIILLTRKDI